MFWISPCRAAGLLRHGCRPDYAVARVPPGTPSRQTVTPTAESRAISRSPAAAIGELGEGKVMRTQLLLLVSGSLVSPVPDARGDGGCLPPPDGLVGWWRGECDAANWLGDAHRRNPGGVLDTNAEVGRSRDEEEPQTTDVP